MGKKHRRQKNRDVDNDDERHEKQQDESDAKINFKDMDFSQRQELKRHQAAQKRKAKQKCYLCGKAGHVRRECPGIADDGRGMSRYKGKSDPGQEKQNYRARKDGQKGRINKEPYFYGINYPIEFEKATKEPGEGEALEEITPALVYYDPHCKLKESIDYIRFRRGGQPTLSEKEALEEYQSILRYAHERTKISGMILIDTVHSHRPWINPCPLSSPSISNAIPIFFVVGLATEILCNTEESMVDAQHILLDTISSNDQDIIGFFNHLDYGSSPIDEDVREEQINKLKCCLQAASDANLPLQVQLSPGVPHDLAQTELSVPGTNYAKVLLDLQATLSAGFQHVQVHLIGWQGRADHMISLLKVFPNLFIGLNASATFSKATNLHEVIFEVPLSRLLLETSEAIPTHVSKSFGRQASPHCAWWPFVAQAVTDHKKVVSIRELTETVTTNILNLYPKMGMQSEHKMDGTSA
mmetsp:Transcript_10638/g.16288  ORF Transcript_10638/g.16288 Transcript_10638/m.16288 type:complete len:469 (-) Transcript_10638:8-1414(-)